MIPDRTTQTLLAAVDPALIDQLVPVHKAPPVIDELTGDRPHASAPQRWASKGLVGVRLDTVTVGRRRLTTRRWLIEFFAAVDEARRNRPAPPSRAPEPSSASATQDEENALARFGIGQEEDA
jgi:Protein of unknown function (DUF1580)